MKATTNSIEPPEIITTKQAADMLGVAVSTVQKLVELGRLASWKTPGGHRRILVSSVKEFLRSSTSTIRHLDASINELSIGKAPEKPVFLTEANETKEEVGRLQATRACGLLDTPAHTSYDRLVRIATLLTNTPIGLVSLLDEKRQWFKSRIGISITETPRSWAFCNYTILEDKIMVVEDARYDSRFEHNPFVTGYEAIRFYAGVPLVDANTCRLGTLCVLDRVPRQLTHDQRWALTELAGIVSEEIQRNSLI